MAEFTAIATQAVGTNQPVNFTETPVASKTCIQHRDGSGIITLRGITNQCRALYKLTFGANIAIPDGGTAGPISVSIAIEGEALPSAQAIVTPATAGDFFNVFSMAFIEVPRGCCISASIRNTSAQTIDVENANLVVERVC